VKNTIACPDWLAFIQQELNQNTPVGDIPIRLNLFLIEERQESLASLASEDLTPPSSFIDNGKIQCSLLPQNKSSMGGF
jgi:hypothetical protein